MNKNTDNIAIGGFDTVAYFTSGKAMPGTADNSYEWQGMRWYFSSPANRDAFRQSPDKYAPHYRGHCAFATSLGRDPLPNSSPRSFKIMGDRLFLFMNPVAKLLFSILPGRVARADEHWRAQGA